MLYVIFFVVAWRTHCLGAMPPALLFLHIYLFIFISIESIRNICSAVLLGKKGRF
jgi:hypothetical protein